MEVPLPRACSRRLMSFFTFHISMFFSASLACGALIVSEFGEDDQSRSGCSLVMLFFPFLFRVLGALARRCVLYCLDLTSVVFEWDFFSGVKTYHAY